jgi:hypothetical protein
MPVKRQPPQYSSALNGGPCDNELKIIAGHAATNQTMVNTSEKIESSLKSGIPNIVIPMATVVAQAATMRNRALQMKGGLVI